MISDQYKCIFVHIPKTGGKSVEVLIWPEPHDEKDLWRGFIDPYHNKYQTGGLQHLFARHILHEVGAEKFTSYYKFSFVRNPWDKAVSQFSYMKTRKDLREYIGMEEDTPFAKYLELTQRRLHVQWEAQHRFLYDENGDLMVDYIGRFENLTEDLHHILKKISLDTDAIPHRNRSDRRGDYTSYYNDETRAMIAEWYGTDIAMFGYEFGT